MRPWGTLLWDFFQTNCSHVSRRIEHFMVCLAEQTQRLIRCLLAMLDRLNGSAIPMHLPAPLK